MPDSKDILEDIEIRMFALDRALPDNSAARDLLEILHRSRVEIGNLRTELDDLKTGKTCIIPHSHEHAQHLYTVAEACLNQGSVKATTPEEPK